MLKDVFVSIKPLHVSVFFHDHLQGILRCALCRYYSSRWFAFVEFVLHSMWPHVYVMCVCLVFLSVGDLLVSSQADKQIRRLKVSQKLRPRRQAELCQFHLHQDEQHEIVFCKDDTCLQNLVDWVVKILSIL